MRRVIALLAMFVFSSFSYAEKPTQESVTRLYVATFERAPDKAGLDYWVNNSGLSLEGIAESFFDQPETQQTYPPGTSNHEFVKAVYEHLFNREPDSAGWQYWESELNQNHIKKSQFILAVINGALAPTGGKDDADILNNKTEVGLYFIENGLNDENLAKEVMKDITNDPQSVQNAKEKILLSLNQSRVCPLNDPNGNQEDGIYKIDLRDSSHRLVDYNSVLEDYVVCEYLSGYLEHETPYKNGVEDGIEKWYYQSGKIEVEIPYVNGIEEGIRKDYYESGQVAVAFTYKNGKLNGAVKYYDESGCLTEEDIFKDDSFISRTMYDCSNSKNEENNYNLYEWNNRPNPQWCPLTDPNGNQQVADYKIDLNDSSGILRDYNNKFEDYVVCSYIGGYLEDEIPYKNGVQEGIQKGYDEKVLVYEGLYKNGKKDGTHKWYDMNGCVTSEEIYDNGTLISSKSYNCP